MTDTTRSKATRPNLARPDLEGLGTQTLLSHGGRDSHNFHGFVNPPVVRASTVLFDSVEAMEARERGDPSQPRYGYGLQSSPLIDALVEVIDLLEESVGTVLVPSGLAAVTVPLLAVTRPGLRVLVPDNVYWPTRRFCDQTLATMGVETVYYDPLLGRDIEDLMLPNGDSVLFAEAPGSNTFEMPDLEAHLAAARAKQNLTMIDNTWATPLIYKPIPAGFDFSIQAGTKYYGGHSDVLIGSISASERAWRQLRTTHGNLGLQAGTEEIALTLRGIRTLQVRLDRHEASALAVARWLEAQPFVSRVLHPALPSDPGHARWQRLFGGRSSGLFAFELAGDQEQARTLLNTLSLFGLGYSWGGYESLAVIANLSDCRTACPWVGGPVIRLSIGLETVDDLTADLARGAKAAGLPVAS